MNWSENNLKALNDIFSCQGKLVKVQEVAVWSNPGVSLAWVLVTQVFREEFSFRAFNRKSRSSNWRERQNGAVFFIAVLEVSYLVA